MKTPLIRLCRRVLVLVSGAALASCASSGGSRGSLTYDPPAHRPQNPAAVRVKVSTGKQAVYVVEGDRVLMATPCSVGTAQAPTPPGSFRIHYKDFKKRRISQPGAGYPMTYWCEFKPSYGFHWGFVKPYPCTHGCIRLPRLAAAKFFHMVRLGTPVHIARSQPEDATAGSTLPVLDDSSLPDPPHSYLMSDQVFEDAKYRGPMFMD